MSISDAQKKAVKKYNSKAYDEIKLRVKKGDREIIQKYVDDLPSESDGKKYTVNSFIYMLLKKEIQELNL